MSLGLGLGLVVKVTKRHECEHGFIFIALFDLNTCFLSMVAKQRKVSLSFDKLRGVGVCVPRSSVLQNTNTFYNAFVSVLKTSRYLNILVHLFCHRTLWLLGP